MVLDKLNKKEAGLALAFFVILAGLSMLDLSFAASIIYNSTRMTVFITNTAPTVIFANVTPNPAIPGQTLTYRANISDPNGDTLTATIIYYNTTSKPRSTAFKLSFDGKFYKNSSFTVPAGADPGSWYVNVTISDGFSTVVNKTSFQVNAQTDTRLQNTPIDFGNQTVGQTAQRAENGTAVAGKYTANIRGWPLIINNTGNVQVNYTINGSNLVGPTKTIGVQNITWNITSNAVNGEGTRAGKFALKTTHQLVAKNKASGTSQRVYFWIDTPNGITQQRLNGTVVIKTSSE